MTDRIEEFEALRGQLGWSPSETVGRLGVSRTTLYHYRSGVIRIPDDIMETIRRMAREADEGGT